MDKRALLAGEAVFKQLTPAFIDSIGDPKKRTQVKCVRSALGIILTTDRNERHLWDALKFLDKVLDDI